MKMLKDFFQNIKKYFEYLMTVNFKELFANVVMLICIIILSSFVYIPIGMIQDLIRSIIVVYAEFGDTFSLVYAWLFSIISAVCAFLVFAMLINKRLDNIDEFKEQMKDALTKNSVEKTKKKETKDESVDLPKVKKN